MHIAAFGSPSLCFLCVDFHPPPRPSAAPTPYSVCFLWSAFMKLSEGLFFFSFSNEIKCESMFCQEVGPVNVE